MVRAFSCGVGGVALAWCLACAGVQPAAEDGAIVDVEEPEPAPDAPDEAGEDGETEPPADEPEPEVEDDLAEIGAAGHLQLPVEGGEVVESTDGACKVLHRSAWDQGRVWDAYRVHLEGQGFEVTAGKVPPFVLSGTREGESVALEATQAGSSVMVEVSLKR